VFQKHLIALFGHWLFCRKDNFFLNILLKTA